MRFSPVPSAAHLHPFLDVPAYREVQPQLVMEMRRARRYEHPLGITMLSLERPVVPARERAALAAGSGEVARAIVDVTPAVYGLLGAYLRNTLRETDILTAAPETLAFATFLPATDRSGAERALARYREGFLDCAGYAIRGGVAVFPGDGLTIEDLLDRARQAWQQQAPHPTPQAAPHPTPHHGPPPHGVRPAAAMTRTAQRIAHG